MSDWRSCENCRHFGKICAGGFVEICITRKVFGWNPIPCKYCGGALSEIREWKDKNGKVIKRYRHCYACHAEFFEEDL